MRQTTLSVALEVKPESFDHLSSLLDKLHDRRTGGLDGKGEFAEFLTAVPVLHFMALSVFPGYDYDPLLVIEANFDGEQRPFWTQLEAAIGSELRNFLRCCKRPLDRDGALFDAVTKKDSDTPIAPYLEARALKPTVFHHGNRGMTRARIEQELELFKATRQEIAEYDASYRALTPSDIHKRLRAKLLQQFSWLDQPTQPRISLRENVMDWLKLIAFVVMLIFALSLPGLVLALAMPQTRYFILLGLVLVIFGVWLSRVAGALPGTGIDTKFSLWLFLLRQLPLLAGFLVSYVVVASAIGIPFSMLLTGRTFEAAWTDLLTWISLGLASVVVTITGILVWLRTLERRDSSQDAPPVEPKLLRDMAKREDWIAQNHMGSVVLIKPGILRACLIRVGHQGLGLLLRATARDGRLGSMRTIHFAHWAMVNNNSRLMFFSNFDQTWESYLDDFIEKAHVGLTLAWSCGIGFPPTRFLVHDGASYGRRFKEWARHSMSVSRFWYSAYKDLTTEQIERNYEIALGLREKTMSDKEAKEWVRKL